MSLRWWMRELQGVGELFGVEDGELGRELPKALAVGVVGGLQLEQPGFPGDQVVGLGLDGQVEQMIVLGMLWQ